MATLRKRGCRYYFEIHDAERTPSRKRISLKTSDLDTANELLGALSKAYRRGEWDPWTDTLASFFDRPASITALSDGLRVFMDAKKESGLSRHTLYQYRSNLRRFAQSVGVGTAVEKITPEQVRSWIQSGGVARSTQQTRYAILRAFFGWLVKTEHTASNPLVQVDRVTGRIKRVSTRFNQALCEILWC